MSLALKASNFLYQSILRQFEKSPFLTFERPISFEEMEFLTHHYHLLGKELPNLLEGVLNFILEPSVHKQTHLIQKLIQVFQLKKFSCYKKNKKELSCIFSNVETPEKISLKKSDASLTLEDIASSRHFEGYFKENKGFLFEIGQLVIFGASSHSASLPKALIRYLSVLFKFIFIRELRS